MNKILAAFALLMAAPLYAATPDSGTLTLDEMSLEYTAGPFFNANAVHQADDGSTGPTCQPPLLECDDFALTLDFPEGIEEVYPNALVRIYWAWDDVSGQGLVDFDCWLYDGDGNLIDSSGAGSSNPESTVFLLYGGVNKYDLRCAPYFAAGDSFTGTVRVDLGEPVEPQESDDSGDGSAGFVGIIVPANDQQSAESRSAPASFAGGALGWFLPLIGLLGWARRRR